MLNTGDAASGLGGQPVVRPNGTVLVPFQSSSGQIRSLRSVDGGASWRVIVLVSTIQAHTVAGGLRTSPVPSAEIDAAAPPMWCGRTVGSVRLRGQRLHNGQVWTGASFTGTD